MTTKLMPPETSPTPVASRRQADVPQRNLDSTIEQIIAKARAVKAGSRGAWILSGLTGLLLWASFAPLDFGSLGWLALVPVMLLVRLPRPTRWMYSALWTTGFVTSLIMLQWMRLGHPAMYIALVALSFYMAFYWPIFVGMARVAVHRFAIPLAVAAPVIWVGLEYLRAHLMTGFAWYFLGHTQYGWIEMIQISDLVGAYGVSFIVATMSACVAMLVPAAVFEKLRLIPVDLAGTPHTPVVTSRRPVVMTACCCTLFAAVLGYGIVRRSQADFQAGPRVGLVQGNFDSEVKHDPTSWEKIYRTHDFLTGQTVQYDPDLIIWPETMFRFPLLDAPTDMSDETLEVVAPEITVENWRSPAVMNNLYEMSEKAGASLIIGLDRYVPTENGIRRYNSAVHVAKGKGVTGRYDKMHRVIFGEYVPLVEAFPWLQQFTPIPAEFGLSKGQTAQVFEVDDVNMMPIICFEDTVPHLVREMAAGSAVGGQPVECFVNLTNDGWFHGSSELDQHLVTSVFRTVETRTPLLRAVNTGVSAVIDGDGVVREPEVFIDGDTRERSSLYDPETGRWRKRLNAAIVDVVPLDNRNSLYVQYGDWFAMTCAAGLLFLLLLSPWKSIGRVRLRVR